MTKHTPGPWEANGNEIAPEDSLLVIARVTSLGGYLQRDANARLIARAPDLLTDGWTLAVMALQSKRYGDDADFRDAVDAMLDTCRVARGEPTREQVLAAKTIGAA